VANRQHRAIIDIWNFGLLAAARAARPGLGGASAWRRLAYLGAAVLAISISAGLYAGTPAAAPADASTGPAPADSSATPAPAPAAPLTEAARKALYPKGPKEMEPAAKADPLEFLRQSLKWHDDHMADYTCQFTKIENIGGTLRKPETMAMKFRLKPFSIYLRWTADVSKGQEVIYVEGTNAGKAYVHPSGILGVLFPKVSIDPLSKMALKHSRRPITMAGMGNMLRLIIPQCEQAKANGDLTLTYEGLRQEEGRQAYLFKRVLPNKKIYPCETLLIYIDCEYFLCTRTDAWDWSGELISHYSYCDFTVNPGLAEDAFSPDNREYSFRLF
jgi:hypothetical protein